MKQKLAVAFKNNFALLMVGFNAVIPIQRCFISHYDNDPLL